MNKFHFLLELMIPENNGEFLLILDKIASIKEIFPVFLENCFYRSNFGSLRAIKDNYPKYVISMPPLVTRNDDNGITHLHLRKFLMEGLEA